MYRNNYPALINASCLAFTCLQLFIIHYGKVTTYTRSNLRRWSTRIYWAAVTSFTLIATISYGIARRWDCLGAGGVTLAACFFAGQQLHQLQKEHEERARCAGREVPAPSPPLPHIDTEAARISWFSPIKQSVISKPQASPPRKNEEGRAIRVEVNSWSDDDEVVPWYRSSRKEFVFAAHASRPFRPLHIIVLILNLIGSIRLARHCQIRNPGERITIDIKGYGTTSVNAFCTTQSVQNLGNKSMVWFEGSMSQGIMDFQGVQHYLLDYDIPSCSYDPPSFGGTDALKIGDLGYTRWQPALAKALKKSRMNAMPTDGKVTYVGWGSSGTALAAQHARDTNHSMLITLDPVPNAAESIFEKMISGWNETQRLALRIDELKRKAWHHRLVLAFGISW